MILVFITHNVKKEKMNPKNPSAGGSNLQEKNLV